ncbi:MAG: class I SAM-dependent methyltransferase [Alphaproteobacteria bacterium]
MRILSSVSRLFGRAKALSEPAQNWVQAYVLGNTPDSLREAPSQAVVWAWEELADHNRPVRHAVDIGCGMGRNSLFLAGHGVEVTALDFAPGAIAHLKQAAVEKGLDHKIRALVYDATEGWPVEQHSMDLVVDAFCFKHIIGREARLAYKQSLINALGTRGAYMISFASVGDGYYGRYIVTHHGDGTALTVDPATNLQSVLFTREHVREFFAPEFKILEEKFTTEPGFDKGEKITRQTCAILFERNPKSQGGGYGKITPENLTMNPRFYSAFPTTDEKDG